MMIWIWILKGNKKKHAKASSSPFGLRTILISDVFKAEKKDDHAEAGRKGV